MNISVTFRHMDTSQAVKSYATSKLGKIQKFLRQPMVAKVTFSVDRLRHSAEVQISSGGKHLEAKETSEDMYASIDAVLDKLERQIRASKGAQQAKRRGGASLRTARSEPVVGASAAPTPKEAERPRRKASKKVQKKRATRTSR
jgi:putative sigma-54 modulation protein